MPDQVPVWNKFMDVTKLIAAILAGVVVWLELAQHAEQARREALFRAVELRSTADARKFLDDLHTVVLTMLSGRDTNAKPEGAGSGISSTTSQLAINDVISKDRPQLREVLAFFSALNGLGSADPCVGAVLQSQFRFEAMQFYAAFNSEKSQLTKILCANGECANLSEGPDRIFESIEAIATNANLPADVCKSTGLQRIYDHLFP